MAGPPQTGAGPVSHGRLSAAQARIIPFAAFMAILAATPLAEPVAREGLEREERDEKRERRRARERRGHGEKGLDPGPQPRERRPG